MIRSVAIGTSEPLALPAGDPAKPYQVRVYADGLAGLRTFVLGHLANGPVRTKPQGRRCDAWVPVHVALVRRPDNDYNPDAISIAAPSDHGGSVLDRHLGYMAEWVLEKYGPVLDPILRPGQSEVTCGGWIELHDMEGDYLETEPSSTPTVDEPFTSAEQLAAGYYIGDVVFSLPTADDVREAFSALPDEDAAPRASAEATDLRRAYLTRFQTLLTSAVANRQDKGMWSRPTARSQANEQREQKAIARAATWEAFRRRSPGRSGIHAITRSVYGSTRILLMDAGGVEVGQWHLPAGPLTLVDERLRPEATTALLRHRSASIRSVDLSGLSQFPDAQLLRNHDGTWSVYAIDEDRPRPEQEHIGDYDPHSGALTVTTRVYRDPVETLVRRHGFVPKRLAWAAPDEAWQASLRLLRFGGERGRPELALRLDRRALIPEDLLRPIRVKWVRNNTVSASVRPRDVQELREDHYYRKELTLLFGAPVDMLNAPIGSCRLCARPALVVNGLAYCFRCCRRSQRGMFADTGFDGPWTRTVLWAIDVLVTMEFQGPPTRSQLARLTVTDPDVADTVMLARMLLALPDPNGASPRPLRPPRSWMEWLQLAGHLADGTRGARGTASIASDGHSCRSLFERSIDDFLSRTGIAHEVEPHYPWDDEFNTTGLRADWRLADGTFVEAFGMDSQKYLDKVERKYALAERHQIRLIALAPRDLARLPEVFADWM